MQRLIKALIMLVLVALFAAAVPAGAQEGEGPMRTTISFVDLQVDPITLITPNDARTVTFGLPAHWDLQETAAITLELETRIDGLGLTPIQRESGYFGLLYVRLNDIDIGSFNVSLTEPSTVSMTLPPTALVPTRDDGLHELRFEMGAEVDCEVDQDFQLILGDDSILQMDFVTQPLSVRVQQLPYPLYQQSFEPDQALMVLPEDPTAEEVASAVTTATAIGRMTDNNLLVETATYESLREEDLAGTHLIFVGLQDNLPYDTFVGVLEESGLFLSELIVEEDDGVILALRSPWDDTRAALVVTGQTPGALDKAATALTGEDMLASLQDNISIITEVREVVPLSPANYQPTRSLAQLGYAADTIAQKGRGQVEFDFELPAGYPPDGVAFVELSVSHSDLLSDTASNLSAEINDTRIGGLRLTERTVSASRVRMPIPLTLLRPGENTLTVWTWLDNEDKCLELPQDESWLTIHQDSLISVPISQLPGRVPVRVALEDYPEPLTYDTQLANVAFILPSDNVEAWDAAVQLALDLGDRVSGRLIEPDVYFGEDVPQDLLATHHVIVIGQPDEQLYLQEINDLLPAPLDENGTIQVTAVLNTNTRLADNRDIGYVQVARSPLNSERIILVVTGTTDTGVRYAQQALTTPEIRGDLNGLVTIVDDTQVVAANVVTQQDLPMPMVVTVPPTPTLDPLVVLEAQPTQVPTETPIPRPTLPAIETNATAETPDYEPPTWLEPAIYVSAGLAGFLLLMVLIGAGLRRMRR